MQQNIVKNSIEKGRKCIKTSLEFATNRLVPISKAIYDKRPKVCPFSTPKCTSEES